MTTTRTTTSRFAPPEPMLSWAEFELAAPELAARGCELLERFQFVFVGTLTRSGAPRVNPVEAYVIDGHLLTNMMPRSLKALDLLRDPRVYVHAPVTAKSGDAELKLAGRAEVLEDDVLRRKLDNRFWELIQWRPAPDSHYFDLLVERAAYVTYGDGEQRSILWSGDRPGERHERRPD
jgi:Pyridoxamine 5'-phosphate oxidase